MSDTIAAVATGNVLSAIGILRLSGDGTLAVIDRVFRPANGRPMSEAPDRKLVYGTFCDTDGQTLDLCLCTVSRGPHSYTGDALFLGLAGNMNSAERNRQSLMASVYVFAIMMVAYTELAQSYKIQLRSSFVNL